MKISKNSFLNLTRYLSNESFDYLYSRQSVKTLDKDFRGKKSLNSRLKSMKNYVSYNRKFTQIALIAYLISHGISVPHYCYHNDLAIVGNCRMCVVELVSANKPIISCTSDAIVDSSLKENGVFADSPLVLAARESVSEFLLLNHPLDCPICDQGGDCDLQDQSLLFGSMRRRFYTYKRIVGDKNFGPIIKTVMTRCIHCTRCIRFMNDIAGCEELGMLGRGGSSEIGSFIDNSLLSELSGNIIDICPVGLLSLKNYKRKSLC